MYHHTLIYRLTVCLLLATVGATVLADDYRHTTSDSYHKSGYDYYWSVIQHEHDGMSFPTEDKADQYYELLDIMARTGARYGHTYQSISLGTTQMYPRLLKLDNDPPLYAQQRYLASFFQRRVSPEKDLEVATQLLELASRMHTENYPPFIEGFTLLRAVHILRSAGLGDKQSTVDARKKGMGLIIEAASLEGVEPAHREFVATEISNYCRSSSSLTPSDREYLCLQLFGSGDAEPWIAHLALGWLMIDKAWDARSNHFAHKINDAQWELFYTYLSVANRHLTQAWKLKPEWPTPAGLMIKVAMGNTFDPTRDEEFWFQQTISARIDDSSAYSAYSLSLAPKWGGSNEGLYALLDSVIEASADNEHMAYIYVQIMATLSKSTQDPDEVFFRGEYLAHATRMMKEEMQSRKRSISRPHFHKSLRAIAKANFKIKNYEDSALLLQGGGAMTQIDFRAWKSYPRFTRYMPALASSHNNQITLALRESDKGNLDGAIQILQGIQRSISEEPDKEYPNILGNPPRCVDQLIRHIQVHGRDS